STWTGENLLLRSSTWARVLGGRTPSWPFLSLLFFLQCSGDHPHLHSFPTRRSSDLPMPSSGTGRRGSPRFFRCAWSLRAASLSRSEEHTSELQSRGQLVCRLLLEKKKIDISSYAGMLNVLGIDVVMKGDVRYSPTAS